MAKKTYELNKIYANIDEETDELTVYTAFSDKSKLKTDKSSLSNNLIRTRWGIFYLIVGMTLIFIIFQGVEIVNWLYKHWPDLAWALGWSSAGIGTGLINSRNKDGKRDKDHLHYVLYFGFALFVAALAGIGLSWKDGVLNRPLSALINLTVGFAAEKLNDLVPLK